MTTQPDIECPIALDELRESAREQHVAITLPPACYTDEEFYRFERSRIFDREWICIGRIDQVANPGDYFTTTIGGEPLIVSRDRNREIHVMSSICRHRGMSITAVVNRPASEWFEPSPEVSGNCDSFRCPYHWWVYDLDGRLIGAPEMSRTENFDPGSIRLPQLKVETWRGFIFASFNEKAAPLAPQLADFDEVLGSYPLEDMVSTGMGSRPHVPFNWKIMVENAMDRYHADRLHAGLHDFAPSHAGNYLPYNENSSVIADCIQSSIRDPGNNPTNKALFPPDPMLSEEERHRALYAFIAPSMVLSVYPDAASYLVITPTGPTSHAQSRGLLVHPDTVKMPNFKALVGLRSKAIENFMSQDLPVDVSVQRGMKSRFAPRGQMSWQEEFLAHWNRWLLRRLS